MGHCSLSRFSYTVFYTVLCGSAVTCILNTDNLINMHTETVNFCYDWIAIRQLAFVEYVAFPW